LSKMDSDSSSESDDEFLTTKKQGNVDREALIRKKLLESFYGQSTGGSAVASGDKADDSDDEYDGNRALKPSRRQEETAPRRNSEDAKDLDSPFFDAGAHTVHHVGVSSLHTLLEMDEQLTLQVRTLDSSTQNMVYENYSKFIDATEAVKSVGTNVAANEQGLKRLQKGMETINEQSRLVEEDLGSLRDAVAEKIRVKRLLTRLDALLKLPETLKEQIDAGKYRTAARSFCSATSILSKHSVGFESLQKIETECNAIVLDMLKDLKRKILHWSGREHALAKLTSASEDSEDRSETLNADYAGAGSDGLDDDEVPPDPPKTVSEIFECAGTLAMIVREKPAGFSFDPGLDIESTKLMSMAASTRFLDRVFDAHQLELQEAAFSKGSLVEETFDGDQSGRSLQSQKGNHLIPTMVIDSILEAATLYGMTFVEDNQNSGQDYLVEFVTEAFSSFLTHVKMVLLEHSLGSQRSSYATNDGEQDGDEVYEDVSGAVSILLHAVRELASGLSLPEVGISADLASNLVDQAAQLAEAIVRRRVDQKFCDLRLQVVNDCLVPFATRAVADDPGDDAPEHTKVLQLVQVAVSDCLQLLDDTIKGIIAEKEVLGASAASIDLPMLKQSIQASAGRFASWLASTLEFLAGCESSNPNLTIEARLDLGENDDVSTAEDKTKVATAHNERDDFSDIANQNDPLAEKVDSAILDLISESDGKGKQSLDFALAVYEMCRGCERAFVDNMNQSIEANIGGGKKAKSTGLFPMDGSKKGRVLSEYEQKTTDRFRLASSRILVLYATNRGFDAASHMCSSLRNLAPEQTGSFPEHPGDAACRVLEIAKETALACAELFNESKRAGPMPDFSSIATVTQPLLGMSVSPLKGLQLDVERMFKEKISVFPHPSAIIDFSRNAVVTIFFKVAFKALAEQTRQCSFSAADYNQLLMDVELLRELVPHYVKENYAMEGSNACSSLSSLLTEVMNSAGERCEDEDCVGNEDLVRRARSTLRDFVKSKAKKSQFFISED
jgi:hypothetical protein